MNVVVAAGRRVDSPDSEQPRFAVGDVPDVAARIATVFGELTPDAVVASAAAGADLLALRAAKRIGARTIVVLPFDADRFERSSVADRPGGWPSLYREMLAASEVDIIAAGFRDDDEAFAAVTEALLTRAIALGGAGGTTAVVIWDGASRGASDETARFAERARELRLRVVEVSTRG